MMSFYTLREKKKSMTFVYEGNLMPKERNKKIKDNMTSVCIEKDFSEGHAELSDFILSISEIC